MARGVKARLVTMLLTLTAVVVLSVCAGLWVVASGSYDVAATEQHWPITKWALSTIRERSVEARAELTVAIPDDHEAVDHGFEHFHETCAGCHGAPGVERNEAGQGLNPRAPRLERAAGHMSDAELFWITKHGIRMTGMPAFGPTHTDQEIAGIVAFIRAMEDMTEQEYAEYARTHEASEHEHE